MEITRIVGREILDSRGNPTVEADVYLADGSMGRAAVPSGASTGEHEAVELRDDDKSRYLGKGVAQGGRTTSTGRSARPSRAWTPSNRSRSIGIMIALDGTPNKGRLGANAILAVSMACRARGGGIARSTALSVSRRRQRAACCRCRMMNILNGGAHADNCVDPQEFMIVPYGAEKFSEALRMGAEVFHTLKGVLKKRGYSTAVGDEGGFAPNLKSNEEALEVVLEAIHAGRIQAGRADRHRARSGGQRILRFHEEEVHLQEIRQERTHRPKQMVKFWADWVSQYPIVSIEDGMAEDDWDGLEADDRHTRRENPAGGRRYFCHQHRDLRTEASSAASRIRF